MMFAFDPKEGVERLRPCAGAEKLNSPGAWMLPPKRPPPPFCERVGIGANCGVEFGSASLEPARRARGLSLIFLAAS